jgi:hypothetical protein
VFSATSYHRRFYSFSQGSPTLSYVVNKILDADELWNEETNNTRCMDKIKTYLELSIECDDAGGLLVAYTMPLPFSNILNKKLASQDELTDEERENPPWFCAFARFLASDEPTLRRYRFTGVTYRGAVISKEDLTKYQVGKMMMNKAFLSTSKSLDVAMCYHGVENENRRNFLLKCIVNDDRAALDIQKVSYYQMEEEEEVLILPCMDFEITEIKNSEHFVQITLLLR